MSNYNFDKATINQFLGKTKTGAFVFKGAADAKWSIGNVPNVSYVIAVMLDAVIQHFSTRTQVDPVALNCFFFNKTLPGHLILEIDELKMSKKGYCVVRCILKQKKDLTALDNLNGYNPSEWQDKVQGIFTMGNMDNEQGVTNFYKTLEPPNVNTLSPYKYFFMGEFLDVKFDMNNVSTDEDVPGKPEVTQLIGFSDGRPVDFKSIPYWCDMFVPPPMLLGPNVLNGQVWCPTMQLEVLFKRRPSGKKVIAHYVANHIINGRFDVTGEIWSEEGDIFALTRHQCLIVPWSRNSSDSSLAQKRSETLKAQVNKL
ncbi:thioesterase-like superfamily-domain-containing protein [Choanephora cucurbitarum]|nr:thioesterase-like superfamily-domain-containing protein [Choanephora cucurbitarum]